jgi:hypothetical protein
MKKIVFLLTAICFFSLSFASSTIEPKPSLRADQVLLPLGKGGQTISLEQLSWIKIKDFEKITGKKMKFFEKISFRIAQKQLRNSINRDGTINNKKIKKLFAKGGEGASGFHAGGFALGLFLSLIGVLIAYLIKDEYESNRKTWAWVGFAAWLVLFLLFIV